jgi:hypothetical protein
MGVARARRAGAGWERGVGAGTVRRQVGTCTGGRRAGAGGRWGAGGERRGADTGAREE